MAQLNASSNTLHAEFDPWGIAARLSHRSHRQAESHAIFDEEDFLPLEAVQTLRSCSEPFRTDAGL